MPTPTDKHHAAPAPPPPLAPAPVAAPAPSPAGPDINIPPPNASVPGRVAGTQPAASPGPVQHDLQLGMSSTQLVVAVLLLAVWAGLLVLARRLLTQSLVAQFADLGRSRAAGTMLYLFLLALGATVIFCALGDFWTVLAVVVPAGVLVVVLLALFLFSLASARASRQRR